MFQHVSNTSKAKPYICHNIFSVGINFVAGKSSSLLCLFFRNILRSPPLNLLVYHFLNLLDFKDFKQPIQFAVD